MSYNDPTIDAKDLLPQSVGKHAHKNKLDEAVFKATKSAIVPAKQKHERTILSETWTNNGAYQVYAELFKRPLGGKEIVLFKTCIIVHKLMRDGHPQCIEDLINRKEYLESLLASTNGTNATAWSVTNAYYLQFILDKLQFHKNHTDIGGEVSLQKYKEKHRKFNSKTTLSLVADLLELQKSLQQFQASVLQQAGLNECKLAALVPCILESYAIYTMTEYFLKKLVDYDIDKETVDKLIEQYQLQYPVVQKFYFNCNTIPFINRLISVPSLPANLPTFKASASLPKTGEKSPKKKKTPREKKSLNDNESDNALAPQSFDILNSTAGRSGSVLSSGGGFNSNILNSGSGFSSLQLVSSNPGFGSGFSQPVFGQPGLGSQPGFGSTGFGQQGFGQTGLGSQGGFGNQTTFGQTGFGSQPGFLGQGGGFVGQNTFFNSPFGTPFGSQPQPQPQSQPQVQPQPQPQPQPSQPQQTRSIPQIVLPDTVKVHQVKESETRDALLARIRELELKIQSLEGILKEKRVENERLKKLLNESGGSVAGERAILEEKFQEQQKQFLATNGALKEQFEKMAQKYEAEKKTLLSGQIDFSKESVDQHLLRFDDPYFLGNKVATGDDILKCTETLRTHYDLLVNSLSTELDTVGKSRLLAEATIKFLDDTKGTILKIEAADIKLQLSEGSRSVASEVSKMLGYTKELAPHGKPDDRRNQFIQAERNRFLQRLLQLEKSVTSSQKSVETNDTAVADLEGLAERELINAAKTIQDAAAALLAENARRQIRVRPGEMDLEGGIMEAAMGIATATQELVTAAAYAQQERVKQGLGKKKDGEPYFRDPRWTEGLISAGKSVAEATRELVKFANKAAQGTIDDAALIAASKVVSASTAALQQATHSKSVPGSKTAMSVDNATSDVSRATKALVAVAQKFQEQEETESKNRGFAGNAEFLEQQALVSRLEVQVQEARRQLVAKRKEKYQSAGGGTSPRERKSTHIPAQAPVYANASIDNSSYINPFSSNSDNADSKVPSYQSKLEASLSRNLNINLTSASTYQQPQSTQTHAQPQIPPPQQSTQFNPFM